jgi:hypothetical protein|tara:strand:- start:8927 stop:9268 length:342 start_codon:yes stop_codon:yes gene_type:complete
MATVPTLFLVAIVGFFFTVTLKLAPHYLDNQMIQATLNQVGESDINGKSDTEIRKKIANFFTINNIRDVNIATIAIDRVDTATRIGLDYEKRIVMFGNVDVVLSFSNQYDSAQ